MSRKAIFIDRDGVMNVDVTPYLARLEQLQVFPYTVEALSLLHEAGLDIFVVSNQQGVALGITTEDELGRITEAIQDLLRPHGFDVKKFYYCKALDTDNHPWRKPLPGMLLAARDEFGVELSQTYFIGDKWSDVECAAAAGSHPLLVLSGVTPPGAWEAWKHQPEKVFSNLLEAAKWVTSQ